MSLSGGKNLEENEEWLEKRLERVEKQQKNIQKDVKILYT